MSSGGPLAGVRVLELGGIGPGPYAGMLLADLGADVVRVARAGNVPIDSPVMRRGKRAIELDLRSDGGRETALELASRADIVIEGFRPGVVEKLSVGPDACLARNTALVYGRMTGWGQDGPLAHDAGHDINYIGLVGALHSVGRAGQPPTIPLCLAGDLGGGGMFMVAGLLAALVHARSTGRGQVVDSAIVDGAAVLMAPTYSRLATGTWTTERGTNLLDGGRPWYDVYETADGGWMAVGALEENFYANFVRVLGLSSEDADRTDPGGWAALRSRLAKAFGTRSRAEWTELFTGAEACVSPVLGLDEAPTYPHLKARGTFDEQGMPRRGPLFSVTPTSLPPSEDSSQANELTTVIADWTVVANE